MFQFVTDLNKEEYDAFVSTHEQNSILQSYSWARIKENWDHLYTGVCNERGKLVAAALVLIKRLPGGFSMMYIPRGPVMNYLDEALVKFYFSSLKKEARKYHALFVKFDPNIVINTYRSKEKNENYISELDQILHNLKEAGAIHQGFTTMISETIQPRFISVVTKEDLDHLPRHTKKYLKEANKRGVQVESGQMELLDDFAALVEFTEKRQGISLRSRDYFRKLLEAYPEDSRIFIASIDLSASLKENQDYLARLQEEKAKTPANSKKKHFTLDEQIASANKYIEGLSALIEEGLPAHKTPAAGTLSIQYGDGTEMLYAGMDERFKKFMPQYKEYLENMSWAFDRGTRLFNMGGVEGSLDDGLTRFKDNFNPTIYELIGEFDLPVNSLLYAPARYMYQKRKSGMHE